MGLSSALGLQSPHWHRVAMLKPRLASAARIRRVWVRGQRWHVLHHAGQGQACRLNPQAYGFAARLDGSRTVDDVWQLLDQQADPALGMDPSSQDDIIELLRLLHAQALLAHEQVPDFGTLGLSNTTKAPDPSKNLWAWRLPLMDPSDWLERHDPWARALFSLMGLTVWLALMGLMIGLWAVHGASLQDHALHWLPTPRSVWLSMLCYPVIKGLHEAAHALAVQRHGGTVKECGLSWMMLMPVPYVDASQAHGFAHAWQRGMVSGAGIMAELALASLGLAVWAWTDAGLLHELGFVVWFMGCTSTLLFNGNPLQRMDGYHLMTDLLQLPGLATRSSQWWQAKWLRWIGAHGLDAGTPHRMDSAQAAAGETRWLVAYAPAAWLYLWSLWIGICVWLGAISAPLGWLASTAVLARLALWPWARLVREAWQAQLLHTKRARSAWRPALALLAPLALLLAPWPDTPLVQGVVWAPEQALIRAEVEGQVREVLRRDGDVVQAGEPLLRLSNPRLLAERERVAAQLDRALQGEFQHMGTQSSQSGQSADEANQLQAQLSHIDEQIQSLTIAAHQSGTLRWPQAQDLPDRYLRRGTLIGHVIDAQPVVVRLALRQDSDHAMQHEEARASVRLSGSGQGGHPATIARDSTGATRQLHSAALSEAMGGDIETDPKDDKHLQTMRPIVWMDVRVPGLRLDGAAPHEPDTTSARLGQRAWVRLDHGMSPLIWQWLRRARQGMDAAFSAR
jgi:putative peptide zinc metalloprotease protein